MIPLGVGDSDATSSSRARHAWTLVLLSPACTAAGFFCGIPILLLAFAAAPAWTAMIALLRDRRRGAAIGAMLAWAALLGTTTTSLSVAFPERAARVVIHGPAYWHEMSAWLETGEGRESRPAEFVPQHVLHAAIFVAASLTTASLLAIMFGAFLMNYMAYYVSRVVLLTPTHPVLAGLCAWHPWSLVRIASFVALGVVLAEPVLSRLPWTPRLSASLRPNESAPVHSSRWWSIIGLAACGLALDILLKAALAPHWPALLRSLR